jgi:hypothetical protein
MRMTWYVAILGALLLAMPVACHPRRAKTSTQRLLSPQPTYFVPTNASPRLGTNEVLRIALEAARTDKFNWEHYVCTAILFGGSSTDRLISNQWILHFRLDPPSPDFELFITVDDSTGRAVLHPHS